MNVLYEADLREDGAFFFFFFLNIGLNVVALNKVHEVAASAKTFNCLDLENLSDGLGRLLKVPHSAQKSN